ncbi:quinolinate synthase NadA [Ferrimicrobium sp.]|uniref:quinolinate synthase NadA n=1 Tax=Ferrimicrobium sp. TaxID=2926050 RepID=UPI0026167E54|nr:quinolinate synthase NadA [Ferrimicrobium sp.]
MSIIAPPTNITDFRTQLRHLVDEHNAIILAHNYQPAWIKEVADVTGDSLYLSQRARETDATTIVFCGVRFMAETAKILSPEKHVLLPADDAECSLADSITETDLIEWKQRYPDAVVVAYVNTSAAVKAMADVCCTSANAVEIVASIPEDREVLFLPDQFLGAYVQRMTGHPGMHIWMGECHVHADISPQHLAEKMDEDPSASLMIHPECGCTTPALYQLAETGDKTTRQRIRILSTNQMIEEAKRSTANHILVATEIGIMNDLTTANPMVHFEAVNPRARCPYMNRITPERLIEVLQLQTGEVFVDGATATKARLAVERMVDPELRTWAH